ncbi:MAG TPA: threonine synthase [Bryobacteraceae bacterium]|nr:threonine synthase [Bryobacteraceae bacterium]
MVSSDTRSRLCCSEADCGKSVPRDFRGYSCPACGNLLQVVTDPGVDSSERRKQLWRERRASNDLLDASGVWRFREFLPYSPGDAVYSLSEGNVPLLPGQKTAQYGGVERLWFKHLGWNPTGSFKDLGMTVAVTEARRQGAKVVACASTGNTAASMAAYAARAGLRARVYLPRGGAAGPKLAQALDFGAEIQQVDGNFDDALRQLMAEPDPGIYFLNSINPFRIEGQKTAIFELLDQMDWNPPDFIVLPGGNLGNSAAFGKAIEELAAAGLLPRVPRLVIVQAQGSNALVRTVRAGGAALEVVPNPQTLASAIRIGEPKSWKKAVRALRFTNGLVLDVTDDEIIAAKQVLGRDGIGSEPASATTLAGVRRLAAEGLIDRAATAVAFLTGHALKDTDAILNSVGRQDA